MRTICKNCGDALRRLPLNGGNKTVLSDVWTHAHTDRQLDDRAMMIGERPCREAEPLDEGVAMVRDER